MVLYELLTGRLPFHGASRLQTLDQVIHREPMPPSRVRPDLPRDLDLICLKCLRKKPGERYASAQELAEDLERFSRGEPIHALAGTVWERMRKWGRRRWVPLLLALVVFFAAVSLFGEWLSFMRHDRETEQQFRQTEEALAEAEASLYRYRLILARQAYKAGQIPQARELLRQCLPGPGRPDRRDPEWYDLWRRCEEKRPGSGRE